MNGHILSAMLRTALRSTVLLLACPMLWAQDMPTKRPVPEEAAQQRTVDILRDVYEREYRTAQTAADKGALAKKILEEAEDVRGDPTSYFVMLRVARDMAVAAGDADTTARAVERLTSVFDVDAAAMKAAAVDKLAKATRSTAGCKVLAQLAAGAIDDALSSHRFELAREIAQTARPLAYRSRDKDLRERIVAQQREIDALMEAFPAYQQACQALEANAADPDANLTAGRYVCLIQGRWEEGIPMLALASDAKLRQLAQRELRKPASVAEEVALADDWWALSEEESGRAQQNIRLLAAARYKHALPDLSGLSLAKAQKRIAEISVLVPDVTDVYPGASPKRFYGDKKILVIMSNEGERRAAAEACERFALAYDVEKAFDMSRADYRAYHTIICGSNHMDYWGKSDAHKQPEAFRHIEAFIRAGGHLIVLGTFNGRNMHHLKQFGIKTGYSHGKSFEPAGEATDLLFQGVEDIVPENCHMRSAGNFSVSAPHTVLLKRGPGAGQGAPALATLVHERGRVTLTMCEPQWLKDEWLITVLLSWVSRGCPTPD